MTTKKKQEWIFKKITVILPMRRAITPVGKITLFDKELTLEQTKNYIKAL